MAWSQSHVEIRLISNGWAGDEPVVMQSFTAEIRNDACAPSSRRWTITPDTYGLPTEYPWYSVVTPDDTERDIACKLEHARKVFAARLALRSAELHLQSLTT